MNHITMAKDIQSTPRQAYADTNMRIGYQFKKLESGDVFLDKPVNISRFLSFKFQTFKVDFHKPFAERETVVNEYPIRECNLDDYGGDNVAGRRNMDEWTGYSLYCADITPGEKDLYM